MIHDGKTNMYRKITTKIEPTNNYALSNDQIWALFTKVPILVIFCWIDFFFSPSMYNKKFFKGGKGVRHVYVLSSSQ